MGIIKLIVSFRYYTNAPKKHHLHLPGEKITVVFFKIDEGKNAF